MIFFFFSSRRRHTRLQGDWSSDVCSSDLVELGDQIRARHRRDALRQLRHHLVSMLDARQVVGEWRAPLPDPKRLAQRRPVLVARRYVRVLAVLAAEARRRHATRMLGAEPWRYFAQGEIPGGGQCEQRHLSIQHREVHLAALAGALPPIAWNTVS